MDRRFFMDKEEVLKRLADLLDEVERLEAVLYARLNQEKRKFFTELDGEIRILTEKIQQVQKDSLSTIQKTYITQKAI